MQTKTWFITGASRGLGKALAEAALANGDVVVGTSRNGKADLAPSPQLHLLPLDLARPADAASCVARAVKLVGRLDVVCNNAGFGLLGAIEEARPKEIEEVFAVNFFGALAVSQAVLPTLRAQGSGHVINVSSIAGIAPMSGSGIYAAAKGALEALSASLSQELAPLGIRVTCISPGAFRTDSLAPQSIRKSERAGAVYAATAHATTDYLDSMDGEQLGDPALAARAIVELTSAAAPPVHLVLGSDALRRTREAHAAFSRELETWEPTTRSTDGPAS